VNIESPDQFQSHVLDAEVPVLVDLWAPWCGPCRMQGPILEELAEATGGRARIAKVNVDTAPEIAMKLRVQSIPTLIVFRGGKEERRFVGVQSAGSLRRTLGI
jgi:thioredoxin 1